MTRLTTVKGTLFKKLSLIVLLVHQGIRVPAQVLLIAPFQVCNFLRLSQRTEEKSPVLIVPHKSLFMGQIPTESMGRVQLLTPDCFGVQKKAVAVVSPAP